MTKYLAIAVGILLLALTGLGLAYRSEVQRHSATRTDLKAAVQGLERAEAQRKRDSATLVARARENAATGRKFAQAQEALSAALQREKVWSEADVPTEVQKALLSDSERSKSDAN